MARRKPDPEPTERMYLGRPIVMDKIDIRQTGGKFSKDLLVANPDELLEARAGDEIMLAMRVVMAGDSHDGEDSNDPGVGGYVRTVVLRPREVTVIDPDLVQEAFARQRERVQRAEDERLGQGRLPTDEELLEQHNLGEHVGVRFPTEGCMECEHEEVLAADGL